MPTKRSIAPRKRPRQERSQATVDAILQAATYILRKRGWAKLTTNAIADRAGVNIASLYQYFPNKEAIVAELRRRWLSQVAACTTHVPPAEADFRSRLRAGTRDAVELHRANPELYRAFSELPRQSRKDIGEVPAAAAPWKLAPGTVPRGAPDPELALYIARVAAQSVLHEVTVERPDLLAREDFVDELVTLIERYLVR